VSQTPPGAAASLLLSSGLHHKTEANPWRITSVQLQNHVGIKALTRLPSIQTRNSLNQQQKVQCNRKELCATDDDQAQGEKKRAWNNLKRKNPWIPNLLSPQSLLQIAIKKLPLSLSLSLSLPTGSASQRASAHTKASKLALPDKLASKAMRQQEQRWRPHTYLVPTYPPTSLVLLLPVFF
jgi:hypothetical protein